MPPYKLDTTLRRGSACLSCRKKKLKCDGIRPVCHQCNRLNRAHACEYDENTQKSRTEMLKEQLATLEKRLQELESSPGQGFSGSFEDLIPFSFDSSDNMSPLYSPHSTTAPLFTTGMVPLEPSPYSNATTSFDSGESAKLQDMGGFHPHVAFSPPRGSHAQPSVTYRDSLISFPDEAKTYLLEVFVAHRHQCWSYGNMDRFTNPRFYDQEPHPALLDAIYLLACHYAQTSCYSEVAPALLTQTMDEINLALDTSDRILDIIQASSLLAIYLYSNNRAIEGYRQSFSAVRLAIGLGLHQIRPTNNYYAITIHEQLNASGPANAPLDEQELKDRILVFWQAFAVDRCWSIFHGLPLAYPGKDDEQLRITTPWPVAPGNPLWEDNWQIGPLRMLAERKMGLHVNSICIAALKAKVATLYDMTARLTSGKSSWSDYQQAEVAMQNFSSAMPSLTFAPMASTWNRSAVFDPDYFSVQTMTYTCFIHLRRDDIFDARAFNAGSQVTNMIGQLSNGDYQYLDPVIGACWFSVSKMFMHVLENAGTYGNFNSEFDILNISRQGLSLLVKAMKFFGPVSPLSTALATKVELHPSSRF